MTNKDDDELRYFAKQLSPTEKERRLVAEVYRAVQDCLGKDKCLQIGSYPRYTSVTPIHDLDILYEVGDWSISALPKADDAIEAVCTELRRNFSNPTKNSYIVSKQSHSATIKFHDINGEVVFSVDIVPSFKDGYNEFNLSMYRVPEIAYLKHAVRNSYSWNPSNESSWVKSDPRGYIELAKRTNEKNDDFRKTVKIAKYWKNLIRNYSSDVKLKSFHLEQVIVAYYQANRNNLTIREALFRFLYEIPAIIEHPRIKDRARPDTYIDEYLRDLTQEQKSIVVAARDAFLKRLEDGFS